MRARSQPCAVQADNVLDLDGGTGVTIHSTANDIDITAATNMDLSTTAGYIALTAATTVTMASNGNSVYGSADLGVAGNSGAVTIASGTTTSGGSSLSC